MTLIRNAITQPQQLRWWQWGQLLGLLLPFTLLYLGVNHPLFWALAAHIFMDFTVQSDETAAGKRQNNRPVIFRHAFISGGYAGLIVGGLPGLAMSALIHFFIDTTNKFGLVGTAGPVLDQMTHVATLSLIWWMF